MSRGRLAHESQMTEFFREVDEDVRRDRLVRLWTEYRYFLFALAVLAVAGTGGWRLYGHYRDEAAQAASAKYEAAAQLSRDGKSTEAAAAFDDLSKTAPKGYAILARLRAADARAASDPKAAIAAYEALAADPGFDPAFKDFAKLRAAMLRVDSDDPLDFERRFRAACFGHFSLSLSDPGAAWPCRVEAERFRHRRALVRRDCLRPASPSRGPYARPGSSRSGSIGGGAAGEPASWQPAARRRAGQVILRNNVYRRDHRSAERWQINAVQPARREKARARERPSRGDPRPTRGRGQTRRSRLQDHRHRRTRGRRQRLLTGPDARADRSGARPRRCDILRVRTRARV